MALRCLLFTADPATAGPIQQVLAGLGVEGEHCSAAVDAVGKVTQQSFQIVIIDWDTQPEAGLLLKAARERKAAERPLTLAVVSDDASAPQALQAGANSILRKPILANQVKDTLTTARDLLRAKESAAVQAATATASASSAAMPASLAPANGPTLRAGEFLQSSSALPGQQFETESDLLSSVDQTLAEPVDALKDLEPMAAAVAPVAEEKPVAVPPPQPNEPHGLQWYLNKRGIAPPAPPAQPSAQTASPVKPASPAKPELLGFDQMAPSYTEHGASDHGGGNHGGRNHATQDELAARTPAAEQVSTRDQKEADRLFAYVTGVGGEETSEGTKEKSRPRFHLGKGTILGALALAACAVVAAPQAPWHSSVKQLWGRGQRALHAWLNPPLVTPTQAPAAHEDFARAGDEYKLPIAENIPDATTDPSQIRVTPVIDPTAKKPDGSAANADQNAAPTDNAATNGAANPGDQPQGAAAPTQPSLSAPVATTGQPPAATPVASPASGQASSTSAPPPAVALAQPHPDAPVVASPAARQPATAAPQKTPQIHTVSASANPPIPSSLSTQIGSMTPDASGNKAPETALDSIEPVSVPEGAERSLLTAQPPIAFPASAKGQPGTVVLQVLIGRDGAVQDAKFLQGSLAFARAAIDGVKQWKFKPYIMNGRPVSVTTLMTMTFKPQS
jgi:periplasmic protein TonB